MALPTEPFIQPPLFIFIRTEIFRLDGKWHYLPCCLSSPNYLFSFEIGLHVAQASFKHNMYKYVLIFRLYPSISQVLRLQACINTPTTAYILESHSANVQIYTDSHSQVSWILIRIIEADLDVHVYKLELLIHEYIMFLNYFESI